MIREDIIARVNAAADGLSKEDLRDCIGLNSGPEELAVVEALLLLSPDVSQHGGLWRPVSGNRTVRILAEIKRYSNATGKRIFRVASALASLPAHEHPTEEELRTILETTNAEFELLPNAMLKRAQQ